MLNIAPLFCMTAARREAMHEEIAALARPTAGSYILVVVPSTIAAYGLPANSTAAAIGAMPVAPLMGPIFGIALGLLAGDRRLLVRGRRPSQGIEHCLREDCRTVVCAELMDVRYQNADKGLEVIATMPTPSVFEAPQVERLRRGLEGVVDRPTHLIVRSLPSRDYDHTGPVYLPPALCSHRPRMPRPRSGCAEMPSSTRGPRPPLPKASPTCPVPRSTDYAASSTTAGPCSP